jgi:pyridoxine 4-dehydrogenase
LTTDTFRIGGDLTVRRLGFGAMQLPTEPGPLRENSIAVARCAVELGITLIDTAYMYGGGANEELLVEALYPYPGDVLIATKVGVVLPPGPRPFGPPKDARLDGRPEVLREQVDNALARLRVDRIELLQLHRVDPETPLADQIGALRDLRDEGKIGRIGLSEVDVAQLAEARKIADIASVQNRYSLLDREHEAVLSACEADGIAFLPWRPVRPAAADATDAITEVANELGATTAQVGLAWLLARSPVICPIPGTKQIAHLEENLAAENVKLTAEHLERLGT